MMEILLYLFGEGKELTLLQVCMRAVLIFTLGLVLIRISGRRSFGLRMPFDNVITILLGAILSRPIVGIAELLPSLCASAIIVILHRLFAWLALKYHPLGSLIKGDAIVIFENGKFNENSLTRCLISRKDLIENIRLKTHQESLEEIKKIFVERSGEISIIKKNENL